MSDTRQSTRDESYGGDDVVVSLDEVSTHFDKEQGFIDSLLNDPERVQAVDGVTLDVKENDVLALVGESGCGKTTLGKTIIGVQRPTEGSVQYRGQDIWDAKNRSGDVEIPYGDIRRALQIIHQDPGASLDPNQKVLTSLEAPLKRWDGDLSTEDRRARIYALLERVGMEPPADYAHRFPHQLSGGEQQRVALVRALLMNPDVILADEAVSALDVSLRVETMDLLLELQAQFGTSFVFISHTLSNARYLAEKADGRIGIMYLGELVEIGSPEDVLGNPKHPYSKVLRWATANLDPSDQTIEDPPVRSIDIPDPVDPPSGCRFNTRCPYIIPPRDLDVTQATYHEILDLRERVERGDVEPGDLDGSIAWRDHLDADPAELPPAATEALEDAFRELASGDPDAAVARLRETFQSVCETDEPDLGDGDHPAACHRLDSDYDHWEDIPLPNESQEATE